MKIDQEHTLAKYKKNKPVEIIKKMLRIFIFHGIKILELNDESRHPGSSLNFVLFLLLFNIYFCKTHT